MTIRLRQHTPLVIRQTRRQVLVVTSSSRPGSATEHVGKLVADALAGTRRLHVDRVNVGDLDLPWCTGAPGQPDDHFVRSWRQRAGRADAHVWVSAEWQGSLAGTLKNALDLLGPDALEGRVVALVAQAGGTLGAVGALAHMQAVAHHLRAWVLPTQVSVHCDNINGDSTPQRLARLADELERAVKLFAGKES
jgi:FMN reductase